MSQARYDKSKVVLQRKKRKLALPLWILLVLIFGMVAILVSWTFGGLVKNLAEKRLVDEYTQQVTRTTKTIIGTTITPELMVNRDSMRNVIERWASHDDDLSMVQLIDAKGNMRYEWMRDNVAVENPIYITLSIDSDGISLGEVFSQWRPDSMLMEIERRVKMAQRFGTAITLVISIIFFAWTHWLVVRPVVSIDNRLRAVVSRRSDLRDNRLWYANELRRLDQTIDLLDQEIMRREEAERNAIEARNTALEANIAKSRFLANMSHELRTPLNAIMGYSELISEDVRASDTSQILKDAERVHSAAEHLLRLINDVLDLSKIEAGKFELLIEEFSIDDLLCDISAMIEPLVENKRNQLVFNTQTNNGSMVADPVRLKQIIYNLLSNACKFTESGVVTLTADLFTKHSEEWIAISISDTGIGIEEEKLESMFEEFSQADASTSRQYGGTGLGLAISRKLCYLMGGELIAHSEVGKGSSFIIYLPRFYLQQSADEPSADVEPSIVTLAMTSCNNTVA